MPDVTVLIIGSGFGGQAAAIELRHRGIDDFLILERRDFMGGTWCQNAYPGAAVDVQSPLYSLSREPWPWTQMFAERDELYAYTQHVIEKHRLRDKCVTSAEVVRMDWEEPHARWRLATRDGRTFTARFVINASGPLSEPAFPKFPGMDTFRGASFHTNAWDHGVDLRGKRVAVVGSGASAAQVIPAIAPDVGKLHVFQRTPHWVMPRPDHHFSKLERAALRNETVYRGVRGAIYWGLETRVVGFKYSRTLLRLLAEKQALKHLHDQVADPALRAKLTPDYTIGCKRIVLSSALYPALCRPNVRLHAKDEAIERVIEDGVVTRTGEHVPLDLIVYATGYDATDGALRFAVNGRDGASLAAFWSDYPRAYVGTTAPGFPNLFLLLGPNTGIGHTSALFIVEAQLRYVLASIDAVLDRKGRAIEVTADAEQQYTDQIHREMEQTVWASGGCKSWYQSRSGHVIAMYPGFSVSYWLATGRVDPAHHRVT